jgi:hypothetical protein
MSLLRYLKSHCSRPASALARWQASLTSPRLSFERADWELSLRDPSAFYLECVRFFSHRLPVELRTHRAYFQHRGRGFGEDAFHTMWYLLLQEFKPSTFLEIGVFRGQVISLVALWARLAARPCEVSGISPFSSAGDSVSKYSSSVDYHRDTLKNFRHFQLAEPQLVKAYSTDSEARQLVASRNWDMIYIDGNHDYEVVSSDWRACSSQLKPQGIVVLDDAGLTTSYQPCAFASRGHPGPSRVADEIDRSLFRELLQVGHNRVFQKL